MFITFRKSVFNPGNSSTEGSWVTSLRKINLSVNYIVFFEESETEDGELKIGIVDIHRRSFTVIKEEAESVLKQIFNIQLLEMGKSRSEN